MFASYTSRVRLVAVAAICIASVIAVTYLATFRTSPDTQQVITIGDSVARVFVADTPESRARGLGGRTGLESDEGMLFVFPEDGRYAFWMKDMRFAIDIVWLSSDGVIVSVESSVQPESYPRPFVPEGDARYVLELPAGYARAHGLAVGDFIAL